ncbi:SdrH family protein, partial [Staphylococcus felis]|uniref:SdrH family protein n=1 Tax=Staphylococcus felis TaxID=46127 RepID=UPI000E369051
EEKPTEEPSTEQGKSEGNVTNPLPQGNHGTNLPQSSEGALNHNQTEPNMSEKTNRFNQYFNALDNNFKYNPLFMERLQNLEASGFLNDQEFQNIDKKMPFQDNRFLNQLQQDSEYFRFQYFNPLNSDSYYKNLDKQVLALMNGEAGAMPGLKTPANRPIAGKAQDKVETIEQNGENMGAGQHHQDKHHSNRHLNTFKEVCFIIICVLIAFLVAFLIWRKR